MQEDDRFRMVRIPPSFDDVLPITAKLLKKQREISEAGDELLLQEEETRTRMRKAQHRADELHKKEQMLVKAIKRFEYFLQDSQRVKIHSETKYEKEFTSVKEIDKELIELEEQRLKLEERKDLLAKYVEKYKPAYEFSEKVVEGSLQFKDIGDLMSYYDILVSVNLELKNEEQQQVITIEELKDKTETAKSEGQNQLSVLRNKLVAVQQKSEWARDKVISARSYYADVKNVHHNKTMTMGDIWMAIANMYMTVCAFEKSRFVEADAVKQMEKIFEFIRDWHEVLPEVMKLVEKDD